MPVADYAQYRKMLDTALEKGYAYPAINVTSTSTANAAIQAFADAKSDGIVQVSHGAGKFASSQGVGDMVVGSISLAQHIRLVAERYDVLIAIHTDHCQPERVDDFLVPLIEETERLRKNGRPNLFNSHMFDGSSIPLDKNLDTAVGLLERCEKSEIILEVEAGVVGGEEDGVDTSGTPNEKLYTTPEDMVEVAKRLGGKGEYMLAATFGNVHGSYKPGVVRLKPSILKDGQDAVQKELGGEERLRLVFHGGSGSSLDEIHETLRYGVVKMNIDTDCQYAYTRAVADYMLKNYDAVLKVDGEVGQKKKYDPRAWMKIAENAMKDRIVEACKTLKSDGKTLLG